MRAPISLAVRASDEVTSSELLYPSQPEGLSSELAETLLQRAYSVASFRLTPPEMPVGAASVFFKAVAKSFSLRIDGRCFPYKLQRPQKTFYDTKVSLIAVVITKR